MNPGLDLNHDLYFPIANIPFHFLMGHWATVPRLLSLDPAINAGYFRRPFRFG